MTIAGVKLVDHLIREAIGARVRHLCFCLRLDDVDAFESQMAQYMEHFDCLRFLTVGPGMGTGGAMLTLLDYFGPTCHAICALDLFGPPGYLDRFYSQAELADRDIMLALTDLGHDDAPIFVATQGDSVVQLGKEIRPSNRVFAHLRWHSERAHRLVREAAVGVDVGRDTLILRNVNDLYPRSLAYFYMKDLHDIDDEYDLQEARDAASLWAGYF